MTQNELLKRKTRLEHLIKRLRETLSSAPEGKLLLKRYSFRKTQLFYKQKEGDKPTYLSHVKDVKLIRKLAQKKYFQTVLLEAETELNLLNKMLKHEQESSIASIFDNFEPALKEYIKPVELSVAEQINQFKERIPNGQFIRTGQYVIKTTRGEYVKSMAEFIIAETLLKYGVPYIYEERVRSIDHQNYKPDFTAINIKTGKILIWEHLGMLEKEYYLDDNIMKFESFRLMEIYPGNGMIITMSSKNKPLKQETVEYIVENSFLK